MADVNLLIKLFDTLKDSSKDTQQMCQSMLSNQASISHYIKSLPLDELKGLIKDHAKNSEDDIGICKDAVEEKSDDILKEVKGMTGKVKTMITVVIVAFSLFTIAGLIGVIAYESRKPKLNEHVDEFYRQEEADIRHDELKKEIIDSLKEELKKFEENRKK